MSSELVTIDTPWSRATLSLFGAQVLSFVPKRDAQADALAEDDLLWMTPTPLPPPAAIRGGVPLCWPWFARQNVPASAPQHGPARISPWRVAARRLAPAGEPELLLVPAVTLDAMSVELVVTVGRALTMRLDTRNDDRQPRVLTQAFHNYLAVRDVERVAISGLDGLPYIDSRDNGVARSQAGDIVPPVALDRVYHGFAGDPSIRLSDPLAGRVLTVSAPGSRSMVVWNPGAALAAGMKDVPGDSWRRFVCIEAAHAGPDRRELQPGQTLSLTQVISAAAL